MRAFRKSQQLFQKAASALKHKQYDAIIVGGGHNGLVSAAYLAKEKPDAKVLVLERRHVVGGAAISEEMVPGFHFSRASYLLSLFRPQIMKDLNLKFPLIERNPSSFTPLPGVGNYLMMGPNMQFNQDQISKFSKKDAENYPKYEKMLESYAEMLEKLIDEPPFDPYEMVTRQGQSKAKVVDLINLLIRNKGQRDSLKVLVEEAMELGVTNIPSLVEILTAPATRLLNRWFESEPLISTLATDAVIGEFVAPSTPGSAYVLLHHVMGDVGFGRGIWCYVRGGMGTVSKTIAEAAKGYGAEIVTNADVKSILVKDGKAIGVVMQDGTEIRANVVLSNLNAQSTFLDMLNTNDLPTSFSKSVQEIDYTSATFKINLAVDRIPNFKAVPNSQANKNLPGPEHRGTIHLAIDSKEIEDAYIEAKSTGMPSKRPVIEMTIPSSVDNTVAPEGKHVVQLFVQYAPNKLADGKSWDDAGRKQAFAKSCYNIIDEFCPGFSNTILGEDLLSPLDLERTFGLRGGNIFQGSVQLNQIYFNRPVQGYSRHATPIKNLYLCGSAAHPGGGVMGAPGRNAALEVLRNWNKL